RRIARRERVGSVAPAPRARGAARRMIGASRALANAMAGTRWPDLPPAAIEDTRRAILDWLGSAMAGSMEPPARMAQRVVATLGESDEATVFGGGRASAAGAALANGVA